MVGTLVLSWLVGCEPIPSDPSTGLSTGPDRTPPVDPTADTALPGPTGDTGGDDTPTGTTGDTGVSCDEGCDDGLACTTEACDDRGRCLVTPVSECLWPAVAPLGAVSLAGADPLLTEHQSGASWNPVTRELWLVRNAGPSGIFRLIEDGLGGWAIDTDTYQNPAIWSDVGDVESVTVVDPVGAPGLVHVLDEGEASIVAFDLSLLGGEPVERETWDLSSWLPDDDQLGAEGLTFVPDPLLVDWGFTDGDGTPRTSTLGMGGLMFVAHQNGGQLYVFDLAPGDDAVEYVATFDTARTETSGLELDGSTGRLYLWHGGDFNDLEVTRLSSTATGGANRRLDTEYLFDHPGTGNLEGVALMGTEDCVAGGRPLFLVEDEGEDRSVELFPDWPIGCR